MLKVWRIQRVHILRGCLSGPEVASVSELNKLSEEVTGQAKHPALRVSNADTGERFGLQYLEPGCQPEVKVELFAQDDAAGVTTLGTQSTVQPSPNKVLPPPLPLAACPRAARTGPIKTGGLLFALDHSRWTQPMRETIDQIVAKHRGQKDFLTKVDAEYAVLVQAASRDPNSLLHPTAKQHRSRYIKHLAKMTNTSSSLNTSSETLLETQRLWHNLTEGSETVAVPVVTIPPATVNPPRIKAQDPPLTKTEIEKMVKDIVQKHQEQQQPAKKRTRNCVACGQPKSRFRGDGSSVHFFYQSGEVKYFYCSVKVHQTYAPEGLTDPRMPFVDFANSPFFMRELEAAKLRKQVMEE
uniref:Uncharacterized protein n=1 Tax=Nothobranchius kadleci TaxID=1051664 RepID=A0A1A8DQX6_NOTKA